MPADDIHVHKYNEKKTKNTHTREHIQLKGVNNLHNTKMGMKQEIEKNINDRWK